MSDRRSPRNSASSTVSVIIPSHNYARYLVGALTSVRAQTYSNWECVVVDDGSTDDTAEVVAQAAIKDSRIRYLHQSNQGPSAARNAGLTAAGGGLIQFLDADDLIEPDKLRLQVAHMLTNANLDIVYGRAWYFPTDHPDARMHSPHDQPWMTDVSGSGEPVIAELLRHNFAVTSAPLVRRSVFDRVGTFNEALLAVEDWEFWLRCALAGCTFEFIDAPATATLIRFHPDSASTDQRAMISSELRVHRDIRPLLPTQRLRVLSRRYEADVAARLAVREALSGQVGSGIRRICGAAFRRPRFRWLALALAMPLFRTRPGRRIVRRFRPGLYF